MTGDTTTAVQRGTDTAAAPGREARRWPAVAVAAAVVLLAAGLYGLRSWGGDGAPEPAGTRGGQPVERTEPAGGDHRRTDPDDPCDAAPEPESTSVADTPARCDLLRAADVRAEPVLPD